MNRNSGEGYTRSGQDALMRRKRVVDQFRNLADTQVRKEFTTVTDAMKQIVYYRKDPYYRNDFWILSHEVARAICEPIVYFLILHFNQTDEEPFGFHLDFGVRTKNTGWEVWDNRELIRLCLLGSEEDRKNEILQRGLDLYDTNKPLYYWVNIVFMPFNPGANEPVDNDAGLRFAYAITQVEWVDDYHIHKLIWNIISAVKNYKSK